MSNLPNSSTRLRIDTRRYLGLDQVPRLLRASLDIEVSEHAFLPQIEDLQRDWVASVAAPAFKLIRRKQGVQPAFCSIGTGTGLDVLAAIETLGASRVGVTDVHADVVAAAMANIRGNVLHPDALAIEAGHGDLLGPVAHLQPRYDLIYENLPNVPAPDAGEAAKARASSSLVAPRSESAPAFVQEQMVTLHYLALRQARDFLKPGGAVLSMLGARVPLGVFVEMARLAGLKGESFTYTWKHQTHPEYTLRAYADQERAGLGPFHFYRSRRLAAVFAGLDLSRSGERAFEIEAALASDRLTPAQAEELFLQGEAVGHTVAVLRSFTP